MHRIAKTYGSISPDTSSAKHFAHFGWGALITFPQGSIFGEQSISIGDNTLISEHVTLSVGYMPGVPTLADSALVIGDRCVVGARCTLTAHGRIELGDDVWLGKDVFISDASHGYQDPNVPVGRQMGEHQPISIGAGSWIGHGAVILPGTTVGRNVVVAAGAVVRGEVPDHSVVAGVPAKIVRRFEPDVGWVSNSGDVRPIIDFEVAANALSQLGDAVEGFTGPLPK
ncbi:MAG: acyltransferase [Actinomycetales bacterium]|nr:acyltransferase [Actinomycetales bacterium]